MADCANVQIMNSIVSKVSAAIASSPFLGTNVYRNQITPIEDSRFVSIYRASIDNEFASAYFTDTQYGFLVEVKARGVDDIESENILAVSINGIIDGTILDGLASSVEYSNSSVEYEPNGINFVYIAVGRIIVKYMLNNDDQFQLI